jgi:IS30 family transposase
MSKNIKGNQRHLTLSDRIYIEQELTQGSTFRSVASILHKDPSTISKEVLRSSYFSVPDRLFKKCKLCQRYSGCKERNVCGDSGCKYLCQRCYKKEPIYHCLFFKPYSCDKTQKPPYICNGCDKQKQCPLKQRIYSATKAQKKYERALSDSRKGINLTPEELTDLNNLISPLVLKGQPLSHIFATHGDEIPCCRRTLYHYFDQRVFQVRNIDLPRRVRYKKRKKPSRPRAGNAGQAYRNKRTYKDFERFVDAHPYAEVIEMDAVKGGRAAGKCLLTLLFRNSSFMLAILLPSCTQESVINAINKLTEDLSLSLFRKSFPVILTDNGSEFKNPYDIEKTPDGKHRTYVFYCDPYVSNQKARLEKNHEYIRYVIPKGRSMYKYTQDDINRMVSHINSTARDGLNSNSPFDFVDLLLDKRIPLLAGLKKVSPDEVMLKPALIEK